MNEEIAQELVGLNKELVAHTHATEALALAVFSAMTQEQRALVMDAYLEEMNSVADRLRPERLEHHRVAMQAIYEKLGQRR